MAQPITVDLAVNGAPTSRPQPPGRPRAGAFATAIMVCAGVLSGGMWSGGVPIPWRERSLSPEVQDHVRRIGAVPHAVGTPAADRVRNYIVERLTQYGLEPQIQEAVPAAVDETGRVYQLVRVRNIVARIAGTAPTKAIVMVAHYDSARYSPGAGDNVAGVAALLEAARVAKTPPPRNDIIMLFSDGEEVGLFGAKAFAEFHPWAKNLGAVVNFDARGNSGPAMLFEHGNQDGWAVRAFGRSAPRPFGSSVAPLLYRWMPNYTDFNVFRNIVPGGLNLAFFAGRQFYHSPFDTVERLNPRSASQHVANASALIGELGRMDLTSVVSEDLVYFDVVGLVLVTYGYPAAFVLSLAVAVVSFLLVGRLLRLRRVTCGGLCIGLVSLPGTSLIAAAASGAIALSFRGIRGAEAYGGHNSAWALIATTVLIAWCVSAALRRATSVENVLAGSVAWWAMATLHAIWRFPGASYVFAWPAAGAALILWSLAALQPGHRIGPLQLLALALGAAPFLLLVLPLIHAVYAAWPWNWFAAAFVAAGLAGFVPVLQRVSGGTGWMTATILAVISAALWGATARRAGFTIERPESTSLVYILSGRDMSAVWMADGGGRIGENPFGQPVAMPAEIAKLGHWYRYIRFGGGFAAAPPALVTPPTASLLSTSLSDDRRIVRLLVRSTRSAPELSVYVTTTAQIERATVDGQSLAEAMSAWEQPGRAPKGSMPFPHRTVSLAYFAPRDEGFSLELETDKDATLTIEMVDRSYDTPVAHIGSGVSVEARKVVYGATLATSSRSF